jgi:hypothetical protein
MKTVGTVIVKPATMTGSKKLKSCQIAVRAKGMKPTMEELLIVKLKVMARVRKHRFLSKIFGFMLRK